VADVIRMSIEVDARDVEKAERALRGVAEEAEKAGRSTKRYSSAVKRSEETTKRATGATKLLTRSFQALGVSIAGLSIFRFAQQIEQATTQMNNINATMRVATGDAAKASQSIGFIRKEAERLGLFFPSVAKQMAQFSAAARGTSITGQELRDIFTGISEASRAMGLTAPQAEGAMLALQQMMSKGKVSAEELRQQLGERMPGSIQIMAQALDVNTQKLFEMMENGELLSDEVLPKFGREMSRVFSAQAAIQSDRIAASIQRLRTAFFDLMAQGDLEGAAAAIDELAETISSQEFQDSFDSLVQAVSNFGGVLAENSEEIIFFTKVLGAVFAGVFLKRVVAATAGLFNLSTIAASAIGPVASLAGGVTALSRVLGLFAGPAGIAATVGSAIALFSSSTSEAEETTRRWREEIGLIADETERLRLESLGRRLDQLQPKLNEYVEKTRAVAEAQRILQERIERGASQSVIDSTQERLDSLQEERDSLLPLVERYGVVQGRLNSLTGSLKDYLDSTLETKEANKELEAALKANSESIEAMKVVAKFDDQVKEAIDYADNVKELAAAYRAMGLSAEEAGKLARQALESDELISTYQRLKGQFDELVSAGNDYKRSVAEIVDNVDDPQKVAELIGLAKEEYIEARREARGLGEDSSKAAEEIDEQEHNSLLKKLVKSDSWGEV